MPKEIKFLGLTIRKGSVELKAVPAGNGRQRATNVIRKQQKREVSFQINDIKVALQMAKNVDDPDRSRLHEIFDYIVKDGHMISQLRVAKNEVLSEPYQIYVNGKPDKKLSEALTKRWLNSIIEYILEAEMYGYSLVELDDFDTAKFSIKDVESIPRDYVSIEKQWILIEGTINGPYLPYGEILETLDLLEFGRKSDFGILLNCAYNVIWKYYSRSDWSRGSEKFGMPILAIEADTNNDSELDSLETKAANFGTDGYIVTQKGDVTQLIERSGQRMHDIWLDNIKLCNEEISKIINGQTSSSDPKAFVGAAEVQERTLEGFTSSRLQNIVDEINEKVFPFLVAKGFSIPEGAKFDYPSLIRAREQKLNGPPAPTAPAAPEKKEDKTPDKKPA